ncbi:FAR1-related sequence 5 [Hibiscus trionum]|uniref:Protein FAR1-RELATED SEQUENCE n=1 Tax=Hibiscus trionum TaxID=183268 RepID=A0A9W7H7K9_HIBTR|nr:FAR1-related sequence 5 [Hibiscus trionum]
MANAISRVLPGAKHRLCLWHIMRNVLSHMEQDFLDGFMRCAEMCRTPFDFESAWKELVEKHNVQGKK